MPNNKLVLSKVFTELRFTTSLLYSDLKLLNSFVNLLKDIFDEVSYDSNTAQVSCSYEKKKLRGFFWNNRLVVDTDDSNYDDFKFTTEQVLLKYSDVFEVNQFQRAGIRFNWIAPFNNVEDAKVVFYDSFFPFLKSIEAPIDIGSINTAKSELHLNISKNRQLNLAIYPVKMAHFDFIVSSSDTQHETHKLEGLMLDSDLFEEGRLTIDNYMDLLNSAKKDTYNKALTLCDIIGVKR